jgi:hypothetical protein
MSCLYDAKFAVKAMLDAHSWPTRNPSILWGGPTKPEDWPKYLGAWGGLWEIVYFGQSTITVPAESLRLGRTAWREEFPLPIIAEVIQEGDDEIAVEGRADQLYHEIIRVLSSDPTLGGTVTSIQGWTSNRATEPGDDRWRCQITVEQSCVGSVNTLSSP